MRTLLVIYIVYILVVSLVSFILYGYDKKLAVKNKPRIKEKYLLESAILGGGIGAFLGRIVFRHKTNKLYFTITIILSVICNVALLGLIIGLM